MESFTPLAEIQPGQELDPYTVLRLRQAALHKGVANEDDQDAKSDEGAEKVAVRKRKK